MIHAIKTTYKGVLFMSTLEADWAKNLDRLHMAWAYEPEGLKLPDGQNYRCDFFLPRLNTWLEVKGPHNERLDKPGLLADSLFHAPGCERGVPVETLMRPSTVAAASCACGFGPDFPWQNMVVGRPAVSGKLTFEAAHQREVSPQLVLLQCAVCQQWSFTDARGLTVCRRCHQDATGSRAYPSRALPFAKIEPPRGKARRK